MSSQMLLTSATEAEQIIRKSASYHPSVWGDYFISTTVDNERLTLNAWSEEAAILKEKVREKLTSEFIAKPLEEKLNLLDAIQRMGIAYHFKEDVEGALKHILDQDYHKYDVEHNLSTMSLLFRLARESGYNISSDLFKQLKDEQGKFKESLQRDVTGMLSLYEATHLRVQGEDILDEALSFTETSLRSMVTNDINNPPAMANQVLRALHRPVRKTLQRVEARDFFGFYQNTDSCDEILLRFAKLDFNILQVQHRKELSSITKWWKKLDFERKLPFARDRITECYFWILGVYHEPEYALARRFATKVISLISVIDDIYDNYGIDSELELFTGAVIRWDANAVDELPEYMKICYRALLDVYQEMEEEMAKEGRAFAVSYAREAMKQLIVAYYKESKWGCSGEKLPTFEEYMKVALVTGAYRMLTTTSFVGMGEIAPKEAFDWLLSVPPILTAISFICRIMDDMVSHEFEQQRDHPPSAVECYMNQHKVSKQETCEEFNKQVTDAWKDINKAFLESPNISRPLLLRMLNLARVMDLLYKVEDGYNNAATSDLKHHIANLLVNHVEV